MTNSPPPTARTYGWLVLGSLAFILYGSLVPFEFRERPFDKVVDAFFGAMTKRIHFESRSDALANIMLGVPLGFSLLAWTCVDRGSRLRGILLSLVFLPLCVVFSATVEFAQLYCPTRTCAASDVIMQAMGVVVGMGTWMAVGQWLTHQARDAWAGPRIGGSAGRMLVAYLALLACVQALPLDLTASPKDIYKNLRDKVTYIPFGEFRNVQGNEVWDRVRSRLEVLGLYLPAGLLAGCLPGRFWRASGSVVPIFGLGLLLGAAMESIQVPVMSRTPSSTDVLVGGIGFAIGWKAANKLDWRWGLAAWIAILLVANWQPFDFTGTVDSVEWLPFIPLEVRNPLFALQDLLTKVILFAPLGVAVACGTRGIPLKQRLMLADAVGMGVSLVIELGQLWLPSHTTSVTDVIVGGVGAWLGTMAATRATRQEVTYPADPSRGVS